MHPDEYHKMAAAEDRLWYYRALHGHVIRSVRSKGGAADGSLLDAGCGTGGLLRRLHAACPAMQLSGLDFSPVACALARQRTEAKISEGSIVAMPYADATFDVVVSCDVVCQVENDSHAVAEIFRCLKPGGIAVLTMPAYRWMYSYHDNAVSNLRRYSRDELNSLLVASGFCVVTSTYWNMLLFPLVALRRKAFPPKHHESDVKMNSAPVETLLNGIMQLEQGWLRVGGGMPFGNSVLTVARKVTP